MRAEWMWVQGHILSLLTLSWAIRRASHLLHCPHSHTQVMEHLV